LASLLLRARSLALAATRPNPREGIPIENPVQAPAGRRGGLTWRQQSVLDLVRRHGSNGIPTEQAGALAHAQSSKHGPETRCRFCRDDGRSILAALRKRGLVKERRADGFWTTPSAPPEVGYDPASAEIPF
jgi:hypothetical protein